MAESTAPSPAVFPTQPSVSQTPSSTGITYANFGQRLLAVIIDTVIVGIASTIIRLIIFLPLSVLASVDTTGFPFESFTKFVLSLVNAAIGFGYVIYFIGKDGQTLGKKALGIKVVKLDSQGVPGYTTAFLREVIGKLVSFFTLGIGYLWMLWDEKKQTLHDKIANTIVVKA